MFDADAEETFIAHRLRERVNGDGSALLLFELVKGLEIILRRGAPHGAVGCVHKQGRSERMSGEDVTVRTRRAKGTTTRRRACYSA